MQVFTLWLCQPVLSTHQTLRTSLLVGSLAMYLESPVYSEGCCSVHGTWEAQGPCPVTQQIASPSLRHCFSHPCSEHLCLLPVSCVCHESREQSRSSQASSDQAVPSSSSQTLRPHLLNAVGLSCHRGHISLRCHGRDDASFSLIKAGSLN